MKVYINYYFENLEHTGDTVTGHFKSPDVNVFCDFIYNLSTKEYEISNYSETPEEILPIPFYWLDMKLEENGKLERTEAKISF